MSRLFRRSGTAAAVIAAASSLTLLAATGAHAVGVTAHSADARFTGSYYVTNTAVKVNGTLKDLGSHKKGSAVYLAVRTTTTSYNTPVISLDGKGSKTIPTTYFDYAGTFLSGTITACSYENQTNGGSAWRCGAGVGVYK
ncbi:hypothetical protein ACFQ2B_38030 [Streptomyces stramineus]|uniref:Uncharacterized protein n=1 Tax=Streptomyces stramineus TaxID=173861 RepID=A0ABN1AD79_9ACTN